MKHRGVVIGIVGAVALAGLVLYVFEKPMRYEIPAEYKGWMVIHFEDPSCQPLRSIGVFRVVSVPSSGRVCTSDHHPDHWIYYKFEYIYSNGTRKSLRWNDHGRPYLFKGAGTGAAYGSASAMAGRSCGCN